MGQQNSCPTVDGEGTPYERGTSRNALLYSTAVCAAVTFLSSAGLIIQHLRRYRVPKEQRQIVKIIFTPVVFAAVSLACVADYHIAPYLAPIAETYEAFALVALFLLLIQYVVPGAEFGEDMFSGMHTAVEQSRKGDTATWPKVIWITVFQYPIAEIISMIILETTTAAGTYCETSLGPRYGHLWATLIRTAGVVVCFLSIVRFFGRMKSKMRVRRTVSKLAALKGIVILSFVQTWVFSILIEQGVINTSRQLSYVDLTYGIPNTVLAAEMVVFSIFSWYAYSSSEYSSRARPTEQPKNLLAAVLDAISPVELLLSIARIFTVLGNLRGGASLGRTNSTYALVPDQRIVGPTPHGGFAQPQSAREDLPTPRLYSEEAPPYDASEFMRPYGARTPSPDRAHMT